VVVIGKEGRKKKGSNKGEVLLVGKKYETLSLTWSAAQDW